MALVERQGRAPSGWKEYQAPTGMKIAMLDSAMLFVLDRARYGLDLLVNDRSPSGEDLRRASTGGCLVVTGPLYDSANIVDQTRGLNYSLHPHRDRPERPSGGFTPPGAGNITGAPHVGNFEQFYERFHGQGSGVIRHLVYNRSRHAYQILPWQRSPPAEWDVVLTGKAVQSGLADAKDQMIGFIALTGNHIVVVQATLKGGQSGDFVREVVAESSAYTGLGIDPGQGIIIDDGMSRLAYCDGNELDGPAIAPPINVRFVPRGGPPGNGGSILRDVSGNVNTEMTGHRWARGAEVPVDNRNGFQRAWDWLFGR